jgi:GTPase SAR1 family protein
MDLINKHIEEFLDYYSDLTHAPEYAVMLKGPWGCGKTWFINHYCEKLKAKQKDYLYISLYGTRTFEEIENSFFEKLHPVLSSKGMVIAGKVLKGVLKTTLKIDLTHNGHAGASVSPQLPDINIPKYLTDTSGYFLIFDDLERCSINLKDILGYINNFVEHHGYKVVIIANEDEIIKKDTDNEESTTSYKRIKEKLIGKTFQVYPDLTASLTDFISKISVKNIRDFIGRNREIIIDVYRDSEYENLRHLKQSLWDFERLISKMPSKVSEKEELLQHLLKLFLAYSFEIKSGNILSNQISKIRVTYYADVFANKHQNKEKSAIQKMREKYKTVDLFDPIIDEKCWQDIFDEGIVNNKSIHESILNSRYFQDEHTPNWVKLWHFINLSDDEFNYALKEVEQEFLDMKHDKIGVVKHIAGIFLFLSDVGLYNKTKNEILAYSKKYVDFLKENNKLDLEPTISFIDRSSWGGLGFFSKELSEFKELSDYIDEKINEAKINMMPSAAKELIGIMKSNPSLFCRMVTLSNSPDQKYYDIPIFKYILPMDFVETFLSLNGDDKKTVAYAIKERYTFGKNLLDELEWLKAIHSVFSEKKQSLRGKLSAFIIQNFVTEYIEKSMVKLENVIQNKVTDES